MDDKRLHKKWCETWKSVFSNSNKTHNTKTIQANQETI